MNFYRFNAKNWHFQQIFREKVAFFTDLTLFGVNFILQKLCKKMTNIRYVFDDPEKSLILQKVFRKSSNILLRKRLVHTFLLHKRFRHTCFVAHTFFCNQNFFRTLFCCRNELRTLFCHKHDLHTCFHAKTIYAQFFGAKMIYAFFLSRKRFTHFVRKVFARWNLPSGKFRLFGPLMSCF